MGYDELQVKGTSASVRSRCFRVDEGMEARDLKHANHGNKVKELMADEERDAVDQG